ncbi:phosphonate ABC transporter, permease protein PhnE [Kibdelosporangium phytohabitans]|uniref:Phosphonate ABC transporter permease n=1 Tax=Kibdelosporangium phytohabitans TaxID=860235 RepID=A0A0N7F308_9PSEU|nr:phosphonate ABC transporter, permease protein PhnE [Kibdelosporangium phytohabitans]ALG07311.1 phosphonate ABC transporter permease [Kibdelosporangium phytohabitans]MBE1471822.1 phosphonate transport system permease protein [Kibdelosporangium phytohabitans]
MNPPTRKAPSPVAFIVIAALVGVHVLAWQGTGFSPGALVEGWRGMADFLSQSFPPDLGVLGDSLDAAVVTLYIGLLGTTFSIPFALLLGVLASRATTPNSWTYQIARSILSVLRSVPDVVFALIFVTAVGLGPFAGVLALVFHNTGVMGKLWAEAMEETDPGPREALRVAGASGAQTAVNAVLPAVLPQMVGLLLYRFDVNVRSSLVLGLVGAGGIGFLINQSIKLFRFDQMVTHIIVVVVVVVLVDQLSAYVRRRLAT